MEIVTACAIEWYQVLQVKIIFIIVVGHNAKEDESTLYPCSPQELLKI